VFSRSSSNFREANAHKTAIRPTLANYDQLLLVDLFLLKGTGIVSGCGVEAGTSAGDVLCVTHAMKVAIVSHIKYYTTIIVTHHFQVVHIPLHRLHAVANIQERFWLLFLIACVSPCAHCSEVGVCDLSIPLFMNTAFLFCVEG